MTLGLSPPQNIERINRPSDEWAIGDAWWDFRRVFIRPGVTEDSWLGTWQLASGQNPLNSNGSSRNPLPRKPYHKSEQGTNLLFFDGHGATYKGVDKWAEHFPINRADQP